MKVVKTVLIFSAIFGVLLVIKLLSVYGSLRLEVNEALTLGQASERLLELESHFRDFINWLWISVGYMLIISFTCIRYIVRPRTR